MAATLLVFAHARGLIGNARAGRATLGQTCATAPSGRPIEHGLDAGTRQRRAALATAAAVSMKSLAAGLSDRFFSVTRHIGFRVARISTAP